MISVKARWERWCRRNCDLRVINAAKKFLCRTESVAMTPKSCDHMPTTSLWRVAAKWPTRAPKTKLILCLRDPQGYSRISLNLSGRILKEYRNIVSASTCGIPWGLRNRTHWSARYTNDAPYYYIVLKSTKTHSQSTETIWTWLTTIRIILNTKSDKVCQVPFSI